MNNQVQNRYPWIVITVFFALLCSVRASEFFWVDGDSPWHVLTGEVIRQTRSIPHTNIWDVSSPSYPWTNISWAYDVWLGIVYAYAGMLGIVAWVLCASTGLLISLVALQRVKGIARSLAVLSALCAYVFLSCSMTARPQLAAQVFFIGYLILLRSRWPIYFRILAQTILAIFWVNTHGSYLLLPLLALAGMLVSAQHIKLSRRIIIECIPLAGILVNPYGMAVFNGAIVSIASDFGPIVEWLQPNFFLQVVIVFLTLFGLLRGSRCDAIAHERVLLLPLAYLAISSARHLPFFAIAATVIVADWLQNKPALLAFSQRISKPIFSGTAAGLFLVYHLFATQIGLPGLFSTENISGNSERIPLSEIAYLRDHFSPQPVFADYNYGGLLLFLSKAEFRPFVDGRAVTAYSNQRLSQYMQIQQDPQLIVQTNINIALLQIGDMSNNFAKMESWEKRFCGPVACIFEKSDRLILKD